MLENNLALTAYCEHDGVRNMSDSYVENLYLRAEEEGLTDVVFMDGSLNNSQRFLEDMKYRSYLFVITSGVEVAGFVWLNMVQHKSAYAHFCLFRDFWGEPVRRFEIFCMNKLLHLSDGQGGYIFDMLIANLPKKNRAACRRVKQSCMTVIGELPCGYFEQKSGQSIPSLLAYATRENLK